VRFQLLLHLWISLGLLSIFPTRTQAQQRATYEWATAGGGSAFDTARLVAADAAGNVYMSGLFAETAYFGSQKIISQGGYDIYLAKYDAQGHLLWVRQAGGPGWDGVFDMTVDATGNAVVTGNFAGSGGPTGSLATMTFDTLTLTGGSRQNELYVARYDAQGNVLWARQTVGQSESAGEQVALDGSGNCYLGGTYSGPTRFSQLTTTTGSGPFQHFLAKYDRLGQLIWLKTGIGDYAAGIAFNTFRVAVTPNNEVYLLGQFRSSITLGSITLTSSSVKGSYYVAKVDDQGSFLWARQDALTLQENCKDFAVAPNGNLLFACEFTDATTHSSQQFSSRGGPDVLILCFSAQGDFLWGKQEGTSNPGQVTDQIGSLAFDGQSNIYTTLTLNFSPQVVSYSSTAIQRWSYASPLPILDLATVAPDTVVLIGQLSGSVVFGSTRLTSAGSSDAYLAKLGVTVPPPVVSLSLMIPNIITPNGDGRNDEFKLPGLRTGTWQLRIYSRWGMLVYQSDDYHQDWDASGLSDGQYYYCLQTAEVAQPVLRGWVEVVH
jgi:gliding motility-associated-like protein